MATRIFSNLELVEFTITSDNGTAYFQKDRLFVGKKINRIFFFLTNSNISKTPYGDDVLTEHTNTPQYCGNIYVNLYDNKSVRFMQDFNALQLQPYNCVDLEINREVNFDLSYIRYWGIPNAYVGYKIIAVIQYESKIQDSALLATNSYSFKIKAGPDTSYELFDFVGKFFEDKVIYGICAGYDNSGVCEPAYLTIRDRYNRVFNEIPLCVFSQYSFAKNWDGYPELQLVNGLKIDSENSFLIAPNGLDSDITITIYYEEN